MTIIDTAISNLYAHGWGKGDLQKDTGEMCLLGALGVYEDEQSGRYANVPEREVGLLAKTIRESCGLCKTLHPDMYNIREVVYMHNDRCLKTQDEAIRLLKDVAND